MSSGDQRTDPYRVGVARPEEIPRIREIEDAAGSAFAGLGLIDETRDVSFPLDDLARLVEARQVWVARDETDRAVGMVIVSVREGVAYVEEIDVHPEHGRRGLGARLLARACEWARELGYPAIALSTFRDVPWNGPFYRRHGFKDLQPADWTPGMRAVREREARHGLRVEARVFMRRELGEVEPATEPAAPPPSATTTPWTREDHRTPAARRCMKSGVHARGEPGSGGATRLHPGTCGREPRLPPAVLRRLVPGPGPSASSPDVGRRPPPARVARRFGLMSRI